MNIHSARVAFEIDQPYLKPDELVELMNSVHKLATMDLVKGMRITKLTVTNNVDRMAVQVDLR